MSKETEFTTAMKLEFYEEGLHVHARVVSLDGAKECVILTTGAGAFFGDPAIRDAFLALAKQIVMYGAKDAPGVAAMRFVQETNPHAH